MPYSPSTERDLQDACLQFRDDPAGWATFMYDWGRGDLEGWDGLDWWHLEVCDYIKWWFTSDKSGLSRGMPCRVAVATGHGTGKTFFISAVLIPWFMATRLSPLVKVTANTEAQLLGNTWRELAKWHRMNACGEWFEWTATRFFYKANPKLASTWRAEAVTWSESNPQAFAGTHEQSGVAMFFDEASDIADSIWEVTDGAMTTPGALWVATGNPNRNIGRFYDCFHRNRDSEAHPGWRCWQIDARKCRASTMHGTEYLDSLARQYGGEDSDEFRKRVAGQFPRAATNQLIATSAVERAMRHEMDHGAWDYAPLIAGIDVARFGSNESEIAWRKGRRVEPIERIPKGDLMSQAGYVAGRLRERSPALVCVDGSGLGAGMVDRLRQLGFSVVDVNGGNASINPKFLNKRAEMWWAMKEFVELGECELPPDDELRRHMTVVEYGYTDKGRLRLKRKEDIMKDFGFSPDKADAIALTFAYPVVDEASPEDCYPVMFEDS